MKSHSALLLGAAALVRRAGRAARTPKTGGTPQVRGQRRAAQLRLPREDLVRVHPSGAAALQHAAQVRHGQVSRDQGRSRRIVDGRERRPDLHVQAEEGRQVPRRLDVHLGGHQGDLRAAAQPAGGRALDARRRATPTSPRSRRRTRTVVFKLKKPNASMLTNFASPLGLRLQRRQAQAGSRSSPSATSWAPARSPSWSTSPARTGPARKFDGYFEKGKPYLDGYLAIFIAGAPMVNALRAAGRCSPSSAATRRPTATAS